VVADRDLLRARARQLGLSLRIADNAHGAGVRDRPGTLRVRHVPLAQPAIAGRLNPANSSYVLRTLEIAADGCRDGSFDALVTAPLQKSVINEAGIAFTGHTE
jgi:4-hydroxythreonine-4-phosphate dehydrogenase